MKYNPRDAAQVFQPGDYPAVIEAAIEGASKAGNEMITLKLKVYSGNRYIYVDEYIVNPDGLWRLEKVAKAIGKLTAFKSGEFLANDYVGESLTVTLKIEPGKGDFPDKNRVQAYKPKAAGAASVPVATNGAGVPMHESEESSQIPF